MADTPHTLVAGSDTPASVHAQQGQRHPFLHHTGKRLRRRVFNRPDGKKVHIASSPEDADELRKTLSRTSENDDFELVIQGSPEHLEALRHAHSHHEERHRQIKEQHPEIANEFERVIYELDALSAELQAVSEQTVQLNANFSKYGYSAHLRTHDDRNDSVGSEDSFNKDAWHAERKLGTTMRFYQAPIVRQYFHKGLLWRAREAQEVASYELFVDLLYVGIIAITGDTAAEHPDGESLLRFAITFIMGWKFWGDIGLLVSWFDSDDVLRRLGVLFTLTCLLGFTTNMVSAFEHTYTPLVAFYLTGRFFMTLSLFWYAWTIPMVRGSMLGQGIISLIPIALWIGSIHVEEPARQGLIWPAILFDSFGNFIMIIIQRPGSPIAKFVPRRVKESLEFFPGTNIEHRIERTNAFVTLVFGSSVLGLLYQSDVKFGVNAFFGKAVLGLIQAFVFNWLYFEIDSFNLHQHAIRRHVVSALVWFSAHLPFIMSFVLSASALGFLVRAHDCPDAPLLSLYKTFQSRSEDHISMGLQWYYCIGLGLALFSLAVITYTHTHRKIPNVRLRKETRLLYRVLISVVIIVLPKAHLNSLQLVATTTGLVTSVLLLELLGSTCWGENWLWDRECKRNHATYSASVKGGDWEKKAKEGAVVNVEELEREVEEKGRS